MFYAETIATWIGKNAHLWRTLLSDTCVDPSKVSFLPPMVDTDMFMAVRKDYSEPRIMVNGKKTHRGNFLRTLKIVCDCLPNCEMMVIGLDSLPKECEGIDDSRFEPLGLLPYDCVPENYRSANIYVILFDSHEGFSLSTLEAMASGYVSLVSRFIAGNMDNGIIVDGPTGFVIDDEDDLIHTVQMLSEKPAELERLGLIARRLIEEQYSLNHCFHSHGFFGELGGG